MTGKKNILVTTLGKSWAIIPELLGFTNPQTVDLYQNSSFLDMLVQQRDSHGIQPADEVWIVTTDSPELSEIKEKIQAWCSSIAGHPEIKYFISKGVKDISNVNEIKSVGDLIYRTVYSASQCKGQGQLLLSLTGGRKTMSADIQQAGTIFGCTALLHVISNNDTIMRNLLPKDFATPLRSSEPDKNYPEAIMPVVLAGIPPDEIYLYFEDEKELQGYRIPNEGESNLIPPSTQFYDLIQGRLKQAKNLLANYSQSLKTDLNLNFRLLYFLRPSLIERLKRIKIGIDPKKQKDELAWLKRLPKTDLHCHLGGIFTIPEIIDIAKANTDQIRINQAQNEAYRNWLKRIRAWVENKNMEALREEGKDFKGLRKKIEGVPEPINISGFLMQFETNPDLLDQLVFGDFVNQAESFFGQGISGYEKLGDLQGSGLLQSEESIIEACKILKKKADNHNVRYLELRCSPLNYIRGGLSVWQVVNLLINHLGDYSKGIIRIIIIGSRHRDIEEIKKHIALTKELIDSCRQEGTCFIPVVGFDLAGNEGMMQPKELRDLFLDLMKECIKITIHAGESENVESIWQAVYHLSADRIGHGLKLLEKPELMEHIKDRKISIELCPSSNFQIVGYRDNYLPGTNNLPEYPLRSYLEKGLRVSINTDNPGISRTDFSSELHRAARLTLGGLSLWDILILIRNGFISSFSPFRERRELIINAEKEIEKLLEKLLEDSIVQL